MKRVVTFGEIMLRLKSPGNERLFQSPVLEATFGGGECNVAVSLANYGLPMSELEAYAPNVRGVTPEQIRDFAAANLQPGEFSIVIVGDSAQFIDAIRAAHPNVEVIAASELDLDSAALR